MSFALSNGMMTFEPKERLVTLTRLLLPMLLLALLPTTGAAGKVLLVLDDMGFAFAPEREQACLDLPVEVAFSIIPGTERARLLGHKCLTQGRDVLAHIPWKPLDARLPVAERRLEPEASLEQIQWTLDQAYEELPMMVAANNHQGSRNSLSPPFLERFAQAWAPFNLPFLDSRTIAGSQVAHVLQRQGISVYGNQMFLDHNTDEASIRAQLDLLVRVTERQDLVIALAHPRPATLKVLHEWLEQRPGLLDLVSASEVFRGIDGGALMARARPVEKRHASSEIHLQPVAAGVQP